MNASKRLLIFERLSQAIPDPKTELAYSSPFELLIAVMLSAQATDKSVNLATARLFPVANTPKAILSLGQKELTRFIQSIGLYRTKAKHVIETCGLLMAHHQGQVPEDRAALESLPGVGRKTANVVLNTAFGWETFAVDTHIFRVSNRTKLAVGKTVLAVEKGLERHVPAGYRQGAHHWLILHGRYICKARKPECWHCGIADLCEYKPKTPAPTQDDWPPSP
ncbi:Nth Predicted EndoIII-related endonuclease [Burkholderiales bacterium]